MTLVQNEPKKIYIRVDEQGWQPGANTIAYYPLTSTSTVNDLSGNNNNGTINGTVTFGTNLGVNCGSFGTGYISVPYDASLDTSTITFSFRGAATYGGTGEGINGGILCRGNLNSSHGIYGIANVGGYGSNFAFQLNGGAYDNRQLMFTAGSQWEYITVTYDGSILKIYHNGALLNTSSYTYSIGGSTQNLYIGAYYSSSYMFMGYLSNLILENKVRTATEISDYYNLTKATYGL